MAGAEFPAGRCGHRSGGRRGPLDGVWPSAACDGEVAMSRPAWRAVCRSGCSVSYVPRGERRLCQDAVMNRDVAEVQCPKCLHIGREPNRGATSWDCPCGYSYYFRQCSSCRVVSLVTSIQRRGEPWHCTWCNAVNQGFSSRNDPAAATLGDLAVDMASHRLEFKQRQQQDEPARDTVPVLIVTTNEVPGYRISHVHGDVFGLIVRAGSSRPRPARSTARR